MNNFCESRTNWIFVQTLGSGAFGQVSLWKNTETGQSVAIKRCSVNLDALDLDQKKKLQTRWKQEFDWMTEVDIPNIVRACPDVCPELAAEQNRMSNLPVIVMEYCDGGNLRSKLCEVENVNGLSEYDVRSVLCDLEKAVKHLHDHCKITHRDIKPDNIVIKLGIDGRAIYKLTDMGYARILDKNTIEGSMVGSPNYFAPEIVEFARYSNSVDYWSLGVVAFEIITGVYPFLQNQTMYEVLNSIKQKPSGCIAITKLNDGKLIYHDKLFPANRLNIAFREYIESWLQLSLEKDGRKRGSVVPDEIQRPRLQFYEKLDKALKTKILTVFWLNRSKFLSYCVDTSTTMDSLLSDIERDTAVSRTKFYFILPAGHTVEYLTPGVHPIQLHDEKFATQDKPMVYLVDLETDSLCNPEDPILSQSITQMFNTTEKLKPWFLKECLMNVLYVYQNEQRRIREFCNGLQEYAMHLEYEIMNQTQYVKNFKNKILHYNGQKTQYDSMVAMGKQLLHEKQLLDIDVHDNELESIAQNLENLFTLFHHYKMILNRIRELIKNDPFPTYIQTVGLHVKNFEDIFEEIRNKLRLISDEELRTHISSLLKERNNFYCKAKKRLQKYDAASSSTSPTDSSDSIIKIHAEFQNIMKILRENESFWDNSQILIAQKTKNFMQKFAETFHSEGYGNLVEKMDTLQVDNFETDTDESLLNISTKDLINNSQILMQGLKLEFQKWK